MSDKKDEKINLYSEFEQASHAGFNVKTRSIQLIGDIHEDSFAILDDQLTFLESINRKAITIKLFSYGGDCYQTNAIIGRIRRSACKIIIEGYGAIMSAGVLILASGDHRRLSKFATIMHHSSNYDLSGTHHANLDFIKQAEQEEQLRFQWLSQFSKVDAEYWRKLAERRDSYMTAEEALKIGVVDELF